MEPSDAAEQMARALRDDRLAVLVGAGASATAVDMSGREYLGLPTPSEFVKAASSSIRYVQPDWTFTETCDHILDREGRSGLEEQLLRWYDVKADRDVPPAQRILSWLPFSLYLSSNYDTFLERSLNSESRRPNVIVNNEDVVRLKRGETPVIKYHGCVSRPETMVAASADFQGLPQRTALIKKMIAVGLAGKNLLVIGHGLADGDLAEVLNGLLDELGQYAPTIFVVRETGHSGRLLGVMMKHEVVTEDLTRFLNRLLHEFREHAGVASFEPVDEEWMTSAFFATLSQAATLPTETQVIDAFAGHLKDELGARGDVASVLADAEQAFDAALRERPNYGALKRVWSELRPTLETISPGDVASAERCVEELLQERERITSLFRRTGGSGIERNKRILVFSQSQRVMQYLQGATSSNQRTCHLFVAECRPKSPTPYRDVEAICRELSNTHYKITACPDVVAMHLLDAQIDEVVLGTHAVYFDDADSPLTSMHTFVNTCGTLPIVVAARDNGVPVVVLGEQLKLEYSAVDNVKDEVDIHQENELFDRAFALHAMRTNRANIEHLNIGYDVVPIYENVTVVVPDFIKD